MKHKKLALGILVILMVTGIAFGSATSPAASSTHTQGVHELAQVVPAWQQVNSNGFGDPETVEVTALEAFNGYLYAGTHHPIDPLLLYDGAQIFRSSDGVTWDWVTQPGFNDPHDSKPPAILDLAVFNGRIYASTGRGNAAQIWRSSSGNRYTWAPMVAAGFDDPDNVDITALAVYSNKIYAGVTNSNTGAQIWRSSTGDSNTWTKVAPGTPSTAATCVTGFAVFNSALYATLESAGPAQIWRSPSGDLNTWTTIVNNGFGDSNNTATGGMAVFGGYLYVGAGSSVDGARLYRTNNGTNWGQAITPGFGDANNQQVEMVFVFQNHLYVSVKNALTGMEIWRSPDGTLWEQANLDGFGDSNNPGSNWSNGTADFLGHLYVGTSNVVDGGELWRMQQQQHTYVPLILR